MNKALLLLIAVIATARPGLAQKIAIDYARDVDYSKISTFIVVSTGDTTAPDELTHNRIKNTIIRELARGGLHSAFSDPDLYVTYHLIGAGDELDTTGLEYGGIGPGWSTWGTDRKPPDPEPPRFSTGTLIVDAYDPVDGRMVWRGAGKVKIEAKPGKRQRSIDRVLTKLGKRWTMILAGKGK
jgi:hypothetical protein